ncbi:MAG: O-antigen ligase family protein [Candidatus Hydrogenedentes bacterium]|nr:O-antigen ligase family protein [Candidatus Hydrogenedentota bacterium]
MIPEPDIPPQDGKLARLRTVFLFASPVLVACPWSYGLTSFLHAKEAALALWVLVMLPLWLAARPPRAAGRDFALALAAFFVFLAGMAFLESGELTWWTRAALVRAGLLISGLLLVADLLGRDSDEGLLRAVLLSGAAVSALAVLQYAGRLPRLFPVFPGYDQPAYSVFGNQDLLGGYAALALAAGIGLLSRRLAEGCRAGRTGAFADLLAALCCTGGLAVSMSRSAWLAAAVGGAVAAASALCRRGIPWRRRIAAGAVLAALVLPALPVLSPVLARVDATFDAGDTGYHVRRWLWAGAWDMFLDRPATGAGLGDFARESPWHLGRVLWADGGGRHTHNELHADNAHGEPLQFLAENGLAGAAALAALAAFWLGNLRRGRFRRPSAGVLGALAALAVFCCMNAGLKSVPHAWAGLLLLCGAGTQRPAETAVSGGRAGEGGLRCAAALLVCAAVAGCFWGVVRPSRLLRHAEDLHLAGDPGADAAYRRVFSGAWPPPQAGEDHAILLLSQGRPSEALGRLAAGRRDADTGRLHLLRAEALHALGRGEEARAAAVECVFRWPGNARAWEILRVTGRAGEWEHWEARRRAREAKGS